MSNFFIKHYGERHQLEKLHEEAAELIEAIGNYFEGKDTIDLVQEEMGDVSNLIGQFEEHWNDGKIYCWKESKQRRQLERIKQEKINEK